MTHYFIDIEAEKEKEQKSSALEDQKIENLNFRERVWVSLFVFEANSKRPFRLGYIWESGFELTGKNYRFRVTNLL